MQKVWAKSCAVVVLFWIFPAAAAFLGDLERTVELGEATYEASFIAPNEVHPRDANGIFGVSSRGVYISVGTERGFMGAAASPEISHLLLLDSNPTAVFFNRVNAMLLAMSVNREDYLELRLRASFEDWRERARSVELDGNARRLLNNPDTFVYWKRLVRRRTFERFHVPGRSLGYFKGMNYLFEEPLYERLRTMARAGRIASVQIDLRKERRRFSAIVRRLAQLELKLSVMDLSNAWYPNYVGLSATWALWAESGLILQPSSILLLVGEDGRLGWSYLGFSAGRLNEASYYKAVSGRLRQLTDEGGILPAKIPDEYANRLDPNFEAAAEPAQAQTAAIILLKMNGRATPTRFSRLRSSCAALLQRLSRTIGQD